MAREYAGDVQFRAVLTIDYPEAKRPDGTVWREPFTRTTTYGPYPKESTAKAQINRQRRYFSGATVTGHVEVGQVTWAPVEVTP